MRIQKVAKPVTVTAATVKLSEVAGFYKGLLGKLAAVANRYGLTLDTLQDLADWLVLEEMDITDVQLGDNFIFSQEESEFLASVVLTNMLLKDHPVHKSYELVVEESKPVEPAEKKPGFWKRTIFKI